MRKYGWGAGAGVVVAIVVACGSDGVSNPVLVNDSGIPTDTGIDAPSAADTGLPDTSAPDVGPTDSGSQPDAYDAASAIVGHWPDSVEDYCAGPTGLAITCSLAPAAGQDGTYHFNVPTYAVANGAVTDSVTSLVWEQSWNGGSAAAIDYAGATAHCAALNTSVLAGFNDWRVPSIRELVTIIDTGAQNVGRLPTATFKNQQQNTFLWSSTPDVSAATSAWTLGMNWSNIQSNAKASTFPAGVMCVRGALPTGGFIALDTDTALDSRTGLTWQRAVGGNFDLAGAIGYCEGLTLSGNSDWRLPNYKELWSIVDMSKTAPATDATIFSSSSAVFWTSSVTTYSGGSLEHAINVDLTTGAQKTLGGDVATATHAVHCVRGN